MYLKGDRPVPSTDNSSFGDESKLRLPERSISKISSTLKNRTDFLVLPDG